MKSVNLTKVLGKVCPRCRQIGSVLYETESRIVYECPGRHQYETRKWQRGSRKISKRRNTGVDAVLQLNHHVMMEQISLIAGRTSAPTRP
jgi:hypothetical protein